MKALLISALVVSPRAQAQVLGCPNIYPLAETALSSSASDPNGIGRLKRGHLSFAYMYFGKLFGKQFVVPSGPVKVKGGWYTIVDVNPQHENWLVCRYGGGSWGLGDIERWEKLAPAITSCKLDVREIKSRVYATEYTVSAICK
ncbi:STY0301 family protein [Massilia aquatica]|uniref:DUF3757 domain-containing protein n=1 Tax=Massilia aquatica TaxID=2609000 RepID=A0ABX0M5U5_9BURK|nr:STY0301 family protein [Massilia aquatica]NHZ41664.1 hypothetical protein [Massilia aquatica]